MHLVAQVENVHVVWVQTEGERASSPLDGHPGHTERPPCRSAVGLYLERLSVEPATTTVSNSIPASASCSSPTQSRADAGNDGNGATGTNGGDAQRSTRRSSSVSSGANRSPKMGSGRGGSAVSTERSGVKKDIELVGLSAYTKEDTADWRESISDETLANDHAVLKPVPPCRGASPMHSGVNAVADASAPETQHATARSQNLSERGSSVPCSTDPVYILRPVSARGTLVIHEGATGQAVPPSSTDSGRPPAGRVGANNPGCVRRGIPGGHEGEAIYGARVEPPPLTAVTLEVDDISMEINVRQYAVLNEAVSTLAMSQRRFRFRRERPTTAVLDDPEAWWRYAIK